jgi:DNA polymerase I-like protein with 3'-5' exonuclease and polymerase domains
MIRLGWLPDWRGRVCIDTPDKLGYLRDHVDAAIASGSYALDTETTGLDVLSGDRMFMFSFSYRCGLETGSARAACKLPGGEAVFTRSVACFVGKRHKAGGVTVEKEVLAELMRLTTSDAKCYMFNAKFDAKILWADGVPLTNLHSDTSLALYVLDPSFGDALEEVVAARKAGKLRPTEPMPRTLKDACALLLDWPADERDEVKAWLEHKFGKNRDKWKYAYLPKDLVATYACGDTERTLALGLYCDSKLAAREQTGVAAMETALTLVVAEMELSGVRVDEQAAKAARAEMQALGQTAHDTMLELTGLANCNFNSDETLIKYAWPALNRHPEATGEFPVPDAWDMDALAPYATKKRGSRNVDLVEGSGVHGLFCKALLDWRGSEKAIGTYLDPWLLTWAKPDEDTGEVRIHAELRQDGTDTGRFSSGKPNMQNVPIEARMLAPSKGCALVLIDYSQLEFRVFAHYAGGDVLDAYKLNKDVDFHQAVAAMLGIPRKPAKNINFGMLYGMGREKLIFSLCGLSEQQVMQEWRDATELLRLAQYKHDDKGIAHATALRDSVAPRYKKVCDAAALYDLYQKKFPRAKQLYYECSDRCKKRGWIKNLIGRRRYLPAEFAHVALNTLIQGGAADVVKRAMLRVAAALLEFNEQHPDANARMLLQIHDELIFEVKECYAQRLAQTMCPIMEDEPLLSVPLVAEADVVLDGEIWMNKHEFAEAK